MDNCCGQQSITIFERTKTDFTQGQGCLPMTIPDSNFGRNFERHINHHTGTFDAMLFPPSKQTASHFGQRRSYITDAWPMTVLNQPPRPHGGARFLYDPGACIPEPKNNIVQFLTVRAFSNASSFFWASRSRNASSLSTTSSLRGRRPHRKIKGSTKARGARWSYIKDATAVVTVFASATKYAIY